MLLSGRLRIAVGSIASDAVLLGILHHNPEVVRLVVRDEGGQPGFLAYLPLNAEGLDAVKAGRLDRRNPDLRLLTRADQRPAALYLWCVYSPGHFVQAMAAIAAHFEEIAPGGVPMFTSAATAHAAKLFASLGFTRAIERFPEAEPDVLVVLPMPSEAAPPGPPPRKPLLSTPVATTTRVTRTIEDVMKVFSIRSATYMNEQACPFEEEFDGNDFCAAHILGEVGGEPAGCIRVRFFGDFVKLERLAVRPEFRKSSLAFRLVRSAIDYVSAKGFHHVYGHARRDLVPFWSRFGFRPIPGRPDFVFSDMSYVEMEGPIAGVRAVSRESTPYEIIRPEGAWDRPGPLDRSAARGQADASK